MTLDSKPGTYGEAWPGGPWLTTADLDRAVLFVRVNDDGAACGKTHSPGDAVLRRPDGSWLSLGPCDGVSPVAFGPQRTVYVSRADGVHAYDYAGTEVRFLSGYLGSQGIRYVTPVGTVISGDSTYGDGVVSEFTYLSDGTKIGQGHDGGGIIAVTPDGAVHRLTAVGAYHTFCRVNEVAGQIAICFTDFRQNFRLVTTLAEIHALPVESAPVPPPQPPPIPEPPPMPIAPNKLSTVQSVIAAHPEINTKADGPFAPNRGGITQLVAQTLGAPWGRKSKDGTATNLSDDALCYLLPDGRFEIYDILTGYDAKTGAGGDACWNYAGTFRDGENGHFQEVTGTPAPPTDPPAVTGGAQLDAQIVSLTAKLVKAQEQITDLRTQIENVRNQIGNAPTLNGRHIALKADNGKYVSAELGEDGRLRARADAVQGWETFTIEAQ